eukprot:TRINITY_DN6100_c0_g1_i1.p2 TRINITY_DN6100_c0_g1~~TRINITY_DN6100_c0_g1_i1.p2  ORF type:complete len:173 (+),score=58.78 TRINITY_DN6100_c0_g1_i1:262-780(+)
MSQKRDPDGQWAKLKSRKEELALKEVKMTKMQQVLSQQSKQLADQEVRRQKEARLLQTNNDEMSKDDLQQAVTTLQVNLKSRDDRILQLTDQLRSSLRRNKGMETEVTSLTTRVKEMEGEVSRGQSVQRSKAAPSSLFEKTSLGSSGQVMSSSEAEPSFSMDVSNNIVCVIL